LNEFRGETGPSKVNPSTVGIDIEGYLLGSPQTPFTHRHCASREPEEEEQGAPMIKATLKQKAGQSGSADTQPYLRDERLEIRVSPHEKKRIVQLTIERGFETTAQYVRMQAVNPGAE